jgi:hypothetical protein
MSTVWLSGRLGGMLFTSSVIQRPVAPFTASYADVSDIAWLMLHRVLGIEERLKP